MSRRENATELVASAPDYILDLFEKTDRIAMLVLNRDSGETIQCITSVQKSAVREARRGCATRTRMGRTSVLRGIEPGGLFFLLPPVGSA